MGEYNKKLGQGETWNIQFSVVDTDGVPVDLTDYTVRSQARHNYSDTTPSASFTMAVPDPTSGVFYLQYEATQSAALTASIYKYDIELVSGSVVTRIVEGEFTVTPEVTK